MKDTGTNSKYSEWEEREWVLYWKRRAEARERFWEYDSDIESIWWSVDQAFKEDLSD